jgi:hypothetical protein
MSVGTVGIVYGLIEEDPVYLNAMLTYFPNSDEPILGGCISNFKTRARVYICPICIGKRKEWLSIPGNHRYNKDPLQNAKKK